MMSIDLGSHIKIRPLLCPLKKKKEKKGAAMIARASSCSWNSRMTEGKEGPASVAVSPVLIGIDT